MSAATLMFSRVALTLTSHAAIRAYVRKSMANRWDDAQGREGDASCPRIPNSIRQYYFGLMKKRFASSSDDKYSPATIRQSDIDCVPDCATSDLIGGGGYTSLFAVSMFWAAGLRCVYHFVTLRTDTRWNLVVDGKNRDFHRTLSNVVKKVSIGTNGFQVVDVTFENPLRLASNLQDHEVLEKALNDTYELLFSHGHAVRCCFINLNGMARTAHKHHVVGVYPCHSSSPSSYFLSWSLCNTWGEECDPHLRRGMLRLENERHYHEWRGVSFIVSPL